MANSQETNIPFSVRPQRRTAVNPASYGGIHSQREAPSHPATPFEESVMPYPEIANPSEVRDEPGYLTLCPWPLIETPSIVGKAASHITLFGKDCVKSFSIVAQLPITHPHCESPRKFKLHRPLFSGTAIRRTPLGPFRGLGHKSLWFHSSLKLNMKKATAIFIRVVLCSCLMACIISMTGIGYHPKRPRQTDNWHPEVHSPLSVDLTRPKTNDYIDTKSDRRFAPLPAQHIQIDIEDDGEPVFFRALMTLDSHGKSGFDSRVKNLKPKTNLNIKKSQVKPKKFAKPKKFTKKKTIPKAKQPKQRHLKPKVYRSKKAISKGPQLPSKLLGTSTKFFKNTAIPPEAHASPIPVIPIISHNVFSSANWPGETFDSTSAARASPSPSTVENTLEALNSEGLLPVFDQLSGYVHS